MSLLTSPAAEETGEVEGGGEAGEGAAGDGEDGNMEDVGDVCPAFPLDIDQEVSVAALVVYSLARKYHAFRIFTPFREFPGPLVFNELMSAALALRRTFCNSFSHDTIRCAHHPRSLSSCVELLFCAS